MPIQFLPDPLADDFGDIGGGYATVETASGADAYLHHHGLGLKLFDDALYLGIQARAPLGLDLLPRVGAGEFTLRGFHRKVLRNQVVPSESILDLTDITRDAEVLNFIDQYDLHWLQASIRVCRPCANARSIIAGTVPRRRPLRA